MTDSLKAASAFDSKRWFADSRAARRRTKTRALAVALTLLAGCEIDAVGPASDTPAERQPLRSVSAVSLLGAAPSCGGDTTVAVVSPELPRDYRPRTPTVFTVAQLEAAASQTEPSAIVLANGVYSAADLSSDFLVLAAGHRLIAQERGAAILEFGVHVGGNHPRYAGAELHGLHFDIPESEHAAQAGAEHAAVVNWGQASDLRIFDCVFDGNYLVDTAIAARQPDGLVVQRNYLRRFRRRGVIADGPQPSLSVPARIADLHVVGVGDPASGTSGADELGVWVGATTHVRRLRVRRVRGHGLVFANHASNCSAADIDVDGLGTGEPGTGVGVYFERVTRDSWLWRFCVGPDTLIGVISEWDHNLPQHDTPLGARGLRNTVSLGLVESSRAGVWFDQGTVDSHVSNVTFRNQWWAAIGMFRNVSHELTYPATQQNPPAPSVQEYLDNQGGSQWGNTFDGSALCNVTRSHWHDPPVCEP